MLPGFLAVSVSAKEFTGWFIQDTKVSDTNLIAQLLNMSGGGYTLDIRDGELRYSFWMGCAGEFPGSSQFNSEVLAWCSTVGNQMTSVHIVQSQAPETVWLSRWWLHWQNTFSRCTSFFGIPLWIAQMILTLQLISCNYRRRFEESEYHPAIGPKHIHT